MVQLDLGTSDVIWSFLELNYQYILQILTLL